jgi:hypothetical protein
MFKIITTNNINIFQEFIPTVNFFNNYYNDINEYLLYIQLYNDIINLNSSSTVIPEDIITILNISELNTQFKISIEIIHKLYVLSDLDTINDYLNMINLNIQITNIRLNDLIIYNDFNIVQQNSFPIFNLNKNLLITIQKINNLTSSVFNYYYTTSDIDFYKQYINYNYITSPLLYINISK